MSPSFRAVLVTGVVVAVLSAGAGYLNAAAYQPFGFELNLLPVIVAVIAYPAFFTIFSHKPATMAGSADRTAALSFTPPPGGALAVVFRQGFIGKLMGMDTSVDGKFAAQLLSPRFTVLTLTPGEHTVATEGTQAKRTAVTLTLAAGEVAFLRVTPKIGSMTLERVPDTAAVRAALAKVPMVVANDVA